MDDVLPRVAVAPKLKTLWHQSLFQPQVCLIVNQEYTAAYKLLVVIPSVPKTFSRDGNKIPCRILG